MKHIITAVILALSSIAYGGLKEGKYLLLTPTKKGQVPIEKNDFLVHVREVEVIKAEGKKYLVIKFKGSSLRKVEASQIRAEIIENDKYKSFYAVSPPRQFKVGDEVIELKRPEIFVGDINKNGLIYCSWLSSDGNDFPSFTRYRMYPLNSSDK